MQIKKRIRPKGCTVLDYFSHFLVLALAVVVAVVAVVDWWGETIWAKWPKTA